MKNKNERTFSRREFAQQAAMLSATASLVPAEVILAPPQCVSPQTSEDAPKLSETAQAEADWRYQQILSLYSERLDEAQKANIKKMCAELQPSLERIRNFKLDNGDAPALYFKPLVERENRPSANPGARPAATPQKP